MKSYVIMVIDAIFFAAGYFILWVFSESYLFDFTQHERDLFALLRFTFLLLAIITPIPVGLIVGRKSPEWKADNAKFKKYYKSLKKKYKIGLILMIGGMILFIAGFIAPLYEQFIYGFVLFELLYDNFFYFGLALALFGCILFLHGIRTLKRSKIFSDLIEDEDTET
jgi:MFS family permease